MFKPQNPRLKLGNGHTISVQASRTHHCEPRNDYGPYSEVEISFNGKAPRYLTPYQNDTVHSYVPVQLITRLIEENGGIVEGELPDFNPQPYTEEEEYFVWADPANLGFTITVVTKSELAEMFDLHKPKLKADGTPFTFQEYVDDILIVNYGTSITEYEYDKLKSLVFTRIK